ncbi:MAG: insulinase family protein [Chloroflexi bacterium]|nr:insulinase family protein [Chloroflexota bacterium]
MSPPSLDKLRILQYPSPILSRAAEPVEEFDDALRALASRMLALMREAKGVGLAAPQVGMGIRLFLEIRGRRGLAYDVHSYVSHFQDDGAVTVYAGVDPKNIDSAVEGILGELYRLKEPIPEGELHKAKEMTKGRLMLRTEDTRSMAGWVGGQELLMGEIKSVDEIVEIVDALSAETLHRVANDLLLSEQMSLAIVGPYRSEGRFQRLLAA